LPAPSSTLGIARSRVSCEPPAAVGGTVVNLSRKIELEKVANDVASR